MTKKPGRPTQGKKPKKKVHISVDEKVHTIASTGNMSQFFNDAALYYIQSQEFKRKMRGK